MSRALLITLGLIVVAGCQNLPHKHVRAPNSKVIIAEYERHRTAARDCYADYLKHNPGLEAKITLKWTVGRKGVAEAAAVVKDELYQPSIGKCLISHLRSIRFPSTPLFTSSTIEYTYNLKSDPIIFR